jgi:KTSC domain
MVLFSKPKRKFRISGANCAGQEKARFRPKVVELIEVVSSNIAKIGHDPETQTLRVKFKGGALWDYAPVPEEEYQALSEAESVGKYFAAKIRPNKDYKATEVIEEIELLRAVLPCGFDSEIQPGHLPFSLLPVNRAPVKPERK